MQIAGKRRFTDKHAAGRGHDGEHLPARIPRDSEGDDVLVWEEGPQEEEAEKEISRRPCNETVELWSSASDFRRG